VALQKVNTDDKDLELLQRYVEQAIIPLQNSPLIGGNLITGVSLSAGSDNLVAHKLGKTPTHFMVLDQDSNANVWSAVTTILNGSDRSALFINLKSNASITISVWVV
jgi:hypothetical protein